MTILSLPKACPDVFVIAAPASKLVKSNDDKGLRAKSGVARQLLALLLL